MPYTDLVCTVEAEKRDAALAACYALGTLGCEEQDHGTSVRLRAFFPSTVDRQTLLQAMEEAGGRGIELSSLAHQDWHAAWRQSVQPVVLTPSVWVSPTWRPPELRSEDHWIRIEPATAFGTGHHQSTRLAARGIVQCTNRSSIVSLLDIGTGSGILCFCGQCCRVKHCIGLDIDPCCLANIVRNRRDNPSPPPSFAIGSIECVKAVSRFDLIVMNMIIVLSSPLLHVVARLLKPQGRFVWSGLLTEHKQEAIDAAAEQRLGLEEGLLEDDWWAGIFSAERSSG